GRGPEPDDLAAGRGRQALARRLQLLAQRDVVEGAERLRVGQRMARDLVARRRRLAQEVTLRLRVAPDREEHGGGAELLEQREQARHGGAIDEVARRQVLEPVALEMAIDRVEVAGEDGVAHATARLRTRLRTAVRTAAATKSTWAS